MNTPDLPPFRQKGFQPDLSPEILSTQGTSAEQGITCPISQKKLVLGSEVLYSLLQRPYKYLTRVGLFAPRSAFSLCCFLFPWVTFPGHGCSREAQGSLWAPSGAGPLPALTQPEVQVVLEVPAALLDGVQHQVRIPREEISIQVFWHWHQIKFLHPPDLKAGFLPSLQKLRVFHHADGLGVRQRMLFSVQNTNIEIKLLLIS